MVRYSVEVKGIVQGVGFRPFVYRLAQKLCLSGFVRNTPQGVSVEIEGRKSSCEAFIKELRESPPRLANIEKIGFTELLPKGDTGFIILSSSEGLCNTFISPDIGICDDCISDITSKSNRRYRYAFTNCTNCGPRFSIINDIPYDRRNTTMDRFLQCPACSHEYENPYDRRFHAQPNACPECGPHLSFFKNGEYLSQDPIDLFNLCISRGEVVALKGIGGFHFVCDAKNEEAVSRLRKRKLRYDKPFAVMMKDIQTVEEYCELNPTEKKVLASPQKPILLLKKKASCAVAPSTTKLNDRLGVMLPYTPLHCIIMQENEVLVMTSGNLSDSPMVFRDEEALDKLSVVCDSILTHNRCIYRRVDDSVCFVINEKNYMLRRARGYAPEPLHLDGGKSTILAVGPQQKNTFCLTKGENAFVSSHIGDLDDADTCKSFESEIESFIRLFDAVPQAVACDMHPDYFSTRYAYRLNIPLYPVQHHHAHFASVLAEHGLKIDNAIGLIFDGTGYGEDGCIWGGEALFGGIQESRRVGHLRYFPLLGGEAAIREPWRAALACADIAMGRETALSLFKENPDEARILLEAGDKKLNSPLTSSMGRLFDAVASLAGVCRQTSYEGQAAIEFQQLMEKEANGSYHFEIINENEIMIFDWRQLICDIVSDLNRGVSAGIVSVRFHRAVVELIAAASSFERGKTGSNSIVISGGVFQNDYLLENAVHALEKSGFTVFTNEAIPMNDGGISFGQAAAAAYRMR